MSSDPSSDSRFERLAREVREVFARVDQDTEALRASTGLSCPPGCGACCENPHIETTVLEMVPAALELVRRGDAEAMLERDEVRDGRGRCAFFASDPVVPGKGRCTMYDHRAGICRLFGFAAVRTRRGRELAVCRVQRASTPEVAQAAERHVVDGGASGDFPRAGGEIAGIDPSLGTKPLHINAALRDALDRVLMERELRLAEVVVPLFGAAPLNGNPEDDEPPTTPNVPVAA